MKTTIKKLEKGEVEITGLIEASEFAKYEDKALEIIGKEKEVTGFRKGKAPINVIKENITEMELLEEMAEIALQENYFKILEENKIDAIGHPQINITKIGKGSDLEFKIVTAVLPEMNLPDYKKIAKEENRKNADQKEIVVEEAEIEKVIKDLRQMRAEQNRYEEKKKKEEKEGSDKKDKAEEKIPAEIPEEEWPELNDDFAKSFGQFKSVEDLKEKIKNNLKAEKEFEKKDKIRLSIVEKIIKETTGDVPEILIKSEIDKMLFRLETDITNAGMDFKDYLEKLNKKEEDLRNEWREDAEKRAKLQIIINSISEKENLKPTEEEISKEVEQLIKVYKEADATRAKAYVEQVLGNEKVFKFLEEQ